MLYTICTKPVEKLDYKFEQPDWDKLDSQQNFKYSPYRRVMNESVEYVCNLIEAVMPRITNIKHVFIDVKIRDMVVGEFGCGNPVWHFDVTRTPWESNGFAEDNHYLFCVGADCKTQFVDEPIEIETTINPDSQIHDSVKVLTIEEGNFYWFKRDNLHRCSRANKNGRRLLVRVTESEELFYKKGKKK